MRVSPLTIIFSLVPEIAPNVFLTWDVLHTERVFLYCHGPTEHTVVLVGSILARELQRVIPNTYARHSSMIGYLSSVSSTHAGIAYWVQLFLKENKVERFHQVRKL